MYDMNMTKSAAPIAAPKVRFTINLQGMDYGYHHWRGKADAGHTLRSNAFFFKSFRALCVHRSALCA